jgi:diguanylate cyclase (GGDEF)-like protein
MPTQPLRRMKTTMESRKEQKQRTRHFRNQSAEKSDSLTPKKSGKEAKFRNALFLIVVLLELNTVLLIGSFVVIRRNSELFFNILLENEEQDLESSVDNIIKDIDQQREDLREEGLTEDEIRAKVQSWLYSKIHTDRFSESQYMWVNEVVNYEGGDNYAIRLIHPAFPQTEGEFLSTKTADIRGNTPYATELETAKTTGSGFQRYYFKDSRTGQDTEKVEYFRLYKDYNWIICEGENLISIETYEDRQRAELMPVVVRIVVIGSIALTVITMITMLLYSSQYNRILLGKNKDLKLIAYRDALTGVYNRGGLIQHLDRWMTDKDTKEMTGVFLDLDDFKLINDLYGHLAGDAALCRLADYLTKSFPNALVGRTGGDEFCVVLRNQSPEVCEKEILEALRDRIEFTADGKKLSFTVSAGYANFPSQADNREEFMRIMDCALYAAKTRGKHEARHYQPEMARIKRDRLGFTAGKMAAGMPGAFLVYRADEKEEILFGNDYLFQLYECRDYDDFLNYTKGSFRNMVHPEDVDRAETSIREQIEKDRTQNQDKTTGFEDYITYRIITRTGKVKRVIDMGRLVPDEHYGEIYYVFLQDCEILKHFGASMDDLTGGR